VTTIYRTPVLKKKKRRKKRGERKKKNLRFQEGPERREDAFLTPGRGFKKNNNEGNSHGQIK